MARRRRADDESAGDESARDGSWAERVDGGYSELELEGMRHRLAEAERVRTVALILGRVGIAMLIGGGLVLFFGWQFVPREAVAAVGGVSIVVALIGSILLRVFASQRRSNDATVTSLRAMLAGAEAFNADLDRRDDDPESSP